jgi:glucose-1-phosphate thymidylyltransferase
MKAIILCAGYATRLYPITKNFPKPLLTIARKEIITHLVEKINEIKIIDQIYVVVNSKFYIFFKNWADYLNNTKPITIIDDKTTDNENRLGAIGDLNYVINKAMIRDDILVLPGDNLYEFDINNLIEYFIRKRSPVIAAYDMKNIDKIRNTFSSVAFDNEGRVTYFEEKPENPKSTFTCPAFYIYPKDFIPKIYDYLFEKNNPDAPGNLIKWAYPKETIYAYHVKEDRYDIGNIESYNETNKIFEQKMHGNS